MKLFKCDHCDQPIYFENYFCRQCNSSLGFDPWQQDLLSLQLPNNTIFSSYKDPDRRYIYCFNKQYGVCNWLLPENSNSIYCPACNLNQTIPDLNSKDHFEKWGRIEAAKHRLIYSLLRFNLPIVSKFQDQVNGVAFDFKAQDNLQQGNRLLTGHENGLITLNIEEADEVVRMMAQQQMDEVYRTLSGHFRHEIGHYYWYRLIRNTPNLENFRTVFGLETTDYAEALKGHYNKLNSDDWRQNYISAYASAHPLEDWAETWAHYMHMVDTLETAYSFGMTLKPRVTHMENEMSADLNIDPYTTTNFIEIIQRWIPLTFAMNSLNRSMGLKDPYPFVITETVKGKLQFIHEMIHFQFK